MKTLKVGRLPFWKTEVVLYQTIDETPTEQWNMCHEYFLRSTDIGNEVKDIYKRYKTLAVLIKGGQKDKALLELNNLYSTYWSAWHHINHKSLSFGTMIHSINGKPIDDYSEDNLIEVLKMLSEKGLTQKMVEEELMDLKKKFNPN